MKTFQLLPGDILLYRPTRDVAGMIIFVKTAHRTGHCELYLGDGRSYTSRVPFGAKVYPLATRRLYKVLRPRQPLDMDSVRRYAAAIPSEPYGWLDLFAYMGSERDWPGRTCSTAVCEAVRIGGVDPFDGEDARKIAPYQFDLCREFADYEMEDTEVLP